MLNRAKRGGAVLAAVASSLVLAACAPSAAPALSLGPPTRRVELYQPAPISSAAFESHLVFDVPGRALYFTRSSPAFQGWKLLVSECRRGIWTEPRPPSFAAPGLEADPFLTADGKSLYFISTRGGPSNTARDFDVWVTRRRGLAAPWGMPERLPAPVNSRGAEWFPRPASDGWLYFGSDRPGGLGGTDIYRARQSSGEWVVENLGDGVNTTGDEYEAEVSPDGERMILMADGDLFMLRREGDGWTSRTRLGEHVNTPALEVGPTFSPTGRTILFARDFGTATLPRGGSGESMVVGEGRSESWPTLCQER